jgi:signal transduction histidine kinase
VPRPTIPRFVRHAGLTAEVLAYVFWLFFDGVTAAGVDKGWVWFGTLAVGVCVAGVVLLRRREGVDAVRVAAVAYGLSLLLTLASLLLQVPSMTFVEQLALAVVTVAALRRAGDRTALAVCGAAVIAIVGSAAFRPELAGTGSVFTMLSALGWGGTIAIGLVLREAEARRRNQLADARSAERMDLARELHDVVAHQVTGIVVAAQAAAVVARTSPDEVDKALFAIENAGAEALTAMRRMVGVLRGQEEGARTPGADLADVAEMVRRFDPDARLVRLDTDPGLEHAVLPAGVAATGFRVVQEALTNVRRHAPTASTVEIEIRIRDEVLVVGVRNDGVRTGGPGHVGSGAIGGESGFGLAGMSERVAALDGALHAGPTGAGVWTVTARLPLAGGAA